MGTLFSAFDIGRAGLGVAQVQLDVTGHNIANVNKEGFSRQRVEVLTRIPNMMSYGALGRGPGVATVARLRDTFLDVVYRNQVPGLGRSEVEAQYFQQVEDVFLEPSTSGFSNQLNVFFSAMSDFSNNVEEVAVRESALSEADALAANLRDVSSRLQALRTNANEEVRNQVDEINSLGRQIADCNKAIFNAELSGHPANDLRDDRDNLLDSLSKLVKITYREQDSGSTDVLIGGNEFVTGQTVRDLVATPNPALDPKRPDLVEVRFKDTAAPVRITDGTLFGVLDFRDNKISAVQGRLDAMAHQIIAAFNGIQSQGNGLDNFRTAMTSTNAVTDPTAGLNSVGLPFTVNDGKFDILLYDNAGNLAETVTVPVSVTGIPPTSLNDIAASINGSTNMTAAVDVNGLLTVTPAAGFSYVFSGDTAKVLPALGMNSLFLGSSAQDITVNSTVRSDPRLLSSGYSQDSLETGDNSAALDMAAVRAGKILENSSQTVSEYYEATITKLGIDARVNTQLMQVETSFVNDFETRRQQTSGVNLDEEVTSLLQFQRAYEASARIITVTDSMLQTIINMAQ